MRKFAPVVQNEFYMTKKFDEVPAITTEKKIVKKQDSDLSSEISSKLSISDKVPKNIE